MDGVVIVTSPQDLVSMIVTKAVKMANMMHIPVLGEYSSWGRMVPSGIVIVVKQAAHIAVGLSVSPVRKFS